MISIDIGGLKILLHFTIEACTSTTNDTNDEDDLLAAFSELGIGRASASRTRDAKKPQATVPTITTAFLYIAKHKHGNFNTLEKVELGSVSMQIHIRHAEQGVAKLKLVLQYILDAAKKEDVGVGLSLVLKDGKLALYKHLEGTGKGPGKDITYKFN
ncbi:hypothetical protein F4604DRAFT_2020737 [Suillus subluteus]|nr:hypothetical protein F4604DRAFT_2020737 [Suillus subluteus]